MNKEQLYINNIYIPLSKSINASITKSITDVENPDKRKATYSKSATIPNSPEAQEVFGDIFEINLTDGSFNPTVKVDVKYLVDGEPILVGYCQLKKVIVTDYKEIEYSITMFGDIANIFRDMGNEELVDLYEFDYPYASPAVDNTTDALKRWDHPHDRDVQADSWATQIWDNTAGAFIPFEYGTGYVYPLIDYGYSTNAQDYDFTQLGTCIYARTIMNAIFAKHGYTWTSTFLDSDYFKRLIIPCSPRTFTLTETQILDREFEANTPAFSGGATSGNINTTTWGNLGTVIFSNEVSDAGGNYDNTTGIYDPTVNCQMDLTVELELSATFTPDQPSVYVSSSIDGRIDIMYNGQVAASTPFYINYDDAPTLTSGARSTNSTPTVASNNSNQEYVTNASTFWWENSSPGAASFTSRQVDPPNKYIIGMNGVYFNALLGDNAYVRIRAWHRGTNGDSNSMFYNGVTFSDGDATLTIESGTFRARASNQNLVEGNDVVIQKTLPKNIKQKDFFMSIVKMHNLWINVDPLEPTNLLIEPRQDFLGTDVEDIQTKWAQDKKTEIIPVGKLDANEYLFTYKQDKDYYNQKYEADWQKIYGQRQIDNENDFVNKTKKTELIFSPTPLAAQPNSDRVMSRILELDDQNFPKDVDFNIRILYYGGLKYCYDYWAHTRLQPSWPYILEKDFYQEYPYAGHVNDPYDWDVDINFGLVNELYYDDNLNIITVSNNNLFNLYYYNMIMAYTNEDSKIVTGYFNVQPSDFKNWTFDKFYWFNNAYHRLQKIENYNPTGESLTKCTFLKLEESPDFTGTKDDALGDTDVIVAPNPDDTIDTTEEKPSLNNGGTKNNTDQNNTSGMGTKIQGSGNFISTKAYQVEIQGDGNKVYDEAKYIKIQGDSNTIDAGITNVTLINSNNLTITESNVTYINGVKVDAGSISQPTAVEDISASQNYDPDVLMYRVDTSGGDVTITFDLATTTFTEGHEYNIKKQTASGKITVVITGGTIEPNGVNTIDIKGKNTNMSLTYNGGSEFIIK